MTGKQKAGQDQTEIMSIRIQDWQEEKKGGRGGKTKE